jgi:secreted PhoX family phosphatase
MILHRRSLIASSAAAAFAGLARHASAQTAGEETYVNEVHGYGPLARDPNRLLDLPKGFSYQVVAQSGDTMDDGLFAPGQPDGMACFPLEDSRVALVVNHELKGSSGLHRNLGPGGLHEERLGLLDAGKAYDTYKNGRPCPAAAPPSFMIWRPARWSASI